LDERRLGSLQVGIEEGPNVIAAESRSLFDQDDRDFRPEPRYGERCERAREPASNNKEWETGSAHGSTWFMTAVRIAE
jgi:hypothetical protein